MEQGVASRRQIVNAYADTFAAPIAAHVRSALASQNVGKLHLAANLIGELVARTRQPCEGNEFRSRVEYLAVIFALESTELRLAGAVAFTTPMRRPGPLDQLERFGPFTATVYPLEVKVALELLPPVGNIRSYELRATPARLDLDGANAEAVVTLANELAVFLRATVKV